MSLKAEIVELYPRTEVDSHAASPPCGRLNQSADVAGGGKQLLDRESVKGEMANRAVALADENLLIRGCLQGDQTCWSNLYQRYRNEVWAALFRVVGPAPELEDLAQAVFFRVYRTLHRFEGRSKLSTWIYGVCVHVGLDQLKRRKKDKRDMEFKEPGWIRNSTDDPCTALERKEMTRTPSMAVSRLKEAKRNVLILHDILEVSADEIGRMLRTPAPTVRSRLFHARRELARHLSRQKRQVEG